MSYTLEQYSHIKKKKKKSFALFKIGPTIVNALRDTVDFILRSLIYKLMDPQSRELQDSSCKQLSTFGPNMC